SSLQPRFGLGLCSSSSSRHAAPLLGRKALMSRVLQVGFTALAAIAVLTAFLQPAAARILCQGEFQVTQYGLIATPYCGDEEIARVAHSYGWREAATVRTNPLSKLYLPNTGLGLATPIALRWIFTPRRRRSLRPKASRPRPSPRR